jgi:hypothetical protein
MSFADCSLFSFPRQQWPSVPRFGICLLEWWTTWWIVPRLVPGKGAIRVFNERFLIRSLGAEVSRDTSPLTPTCLVKCEKPKRQRNQAAEETKVTREFGIRNGRSGRFLQMVLAIMQTRPI